MRKNKRLAAVASALLMAITFTSCTSNETTADPQGSENPPAPVEAGTPAQNDEQQIYTIAVVSKDATMPWFVRMDTGVQKFAADSGQDAFQKGPAEVDVTLQAQIIEDLIAQDVDAICVVPIDPGALEPVCKKAMDAGIVVISHEGSTLENCNYDIEAFNNTQYGAFIMDNLAEAMGEEGTYTTMVAHVTNASHNEWADGGVSRQESAYPNMKLLTEEPRVESEGNTDTAYQRAKELLKMYPDIKGIMGTASQDAPGVARAIEELGLIGKVFTAGTGMPEENAETLKKGYVSAVTVWDPADAGYAMCALAVKVLNGEKIENGCNLGLKGYENLNFSAGSTKVLEGQGWVVITKDNVDSFGF